VNSVLAADLSTHLRRDKNEIAFFPASIEKKHHGESAHFEYFCSEPARFFSLSLKNVQAIDDWSPQKIFFKAEFSKRVRRY